MRRGHTKAKTARHLRQVGTIGICLDCSNRSDFFCHLAENGVDAKKLQDVAAWGLARIAVLATYGHNSFERLPLE